MTTTTRPSALSAADAHALVAAERAKRQTKKAEGTKAAPLAPVKTAAAKPEPKVRPTLQALQTRKNGTMSARGLTCLCGCGAATHTADARFLSGHDAKLRRNVLLFGQALPEIIRPFFLKGEVIAGMALGEDEAGNEIMIDRKPGGRMEGFAGI